MKPDRGGRIPHPALGATLFLTVLLVPIGLQAQEPPTGPPAGECRCGELRFFERLPEELRDRLDEGTWGEFPETWHEMFPEGFGGAIRWQRENSSPDHVLEGILGDTLRERRMFIYPGLERGLERLMLRPAPARFGVRLYDLGQDLGRYFGRDEGVLVLEVDDDAALDLQPGDVIVAIDARSVENAGHAVRILQSYEAGESMSLEVWRDGRLVRVEGIAP